MTGLITDSYHWNIHQGAQQATEETNSKKKNMYGEGFLWMKRENSTYSSRLRSAALFNILFPLVVYMNSLPPLFSIQYSILKFQQFFKPSTLH